MAIAIPASRAGLAGGVVLSAHARALSAHMADEAQERATFGELLRRWRTKRGLTQEQLADKAAVARRYLASLEGDEVNDPGREIVRKLAEALAIRTSVLSRSLGWVPVDELDGDPNDGLLSGLNDDEKDLIEGIAVRFRENKERR